MSKDAEHRLAIYGSLAPGRENHHELDGVNGTWSKGVVRGFLVEMGWGADMGYPAIMLDDEGDAIDVLLLQSEDLPKHWSRLDEFEGDQYQRRSVSVETETGSLLASIYTLNATQD